jgi:hypothetical protein
MTTSASPPLLAQPLATDDVPSAPPAAENRVSKIDVFVGPRFQITWSTPSAVRARPSWTPGCAGPLTRFQAVDLAAEPAAAPSAAAATAAASKIKRGRCM